MQEQRELERAVRHLQSQIDTLRGRTDETPVRYPRPVASGSGAGQYGVVRSWAVDDRPEVNVTVLTAKARTGTITEISQAVAAVVTVATDHGLLAGDSIAFSGVLGMTEINGLTGVISSVTATTVTVAIDSSGFTAYSSGGTWTLGTVFDWWLNADTTEKVATEPRTNAINYDAFKFVGTDETYPLLLPTGVVALPIMVMGGVKTVFHHSKIFHDSVPPGMPITEGIIVNGKGELQFAN